MDSEKDLPRVPTKWALFTIAALAAIIAAILLYFVVYEPKRDNPPTSNQTQTLSVKPYSVQYCNIGQLSNAQLRVYPNNINVNLDRSAIKITAWLVGDLEDTCHLHLLAISDVPHIHTEQHLIKASTSERIYQFTLHANAGGHLCIVFADFPTSHCSKENYPNSSITITDSQTLLKAFIPQTFYWTGDQTQNMVIIGKHFPENPIVEVAGNLAKVLSRTDNTLEIEFRDPATVGDSALTWVKIYNPETMVIAEKNNLSFVNKR